MAFGSWIRAEREQAGISLKDFAQAIGISQAYWSRIERGLELAPKDSLIIAACEQLGLATDRAFRAPVEEAAFFRTVAHRWTRRPAQSSPG